jgi:hypothetical protein
MMGTTSNSLLMRNSVFGWIAVATCGLLLIPLGAMQFTREVKWDVTDFIVMGLLIFAAGSVFVLAARRMPPRYRLALGVVVAGAFLYVWAEFAVGIFTNLGS